MDNNRNTTYIDQIIVRVWKACNFKCNFCNVSDNEGNVKFRENFEDMIRNFHYKYKYSNISWWDVIVTISWWEPSIFKKETLFMLKYVNNFLSKKWIIPRFEIQTNASGVDERFANQLKRNWIQSSLVSFHTMDKEIFEKTIWVWFSFFNKIINWINNLHNAWISVDTNSILSSQNKDNFFETIKYICKNFPYIKTHNIWLIQPHGEAEKILNEIMPQYIEVADVYNRSIEYLKRKNKDFTSHYVWLPVCYLSHPLYSLESWDNLLFRRTYNFSQKHLTNSINDSNKIQTKDCSHCLYNNICSWIWKEYEWLQKLRPLNYIVDFEWIFTYNDFAYKLDSANASLKKIFSKNIRQILIKSDLWNKSYIYKNIIESNKIWFYKISLLIVNDFEFDEKIFETWLSNIQIPIEKLNLDFLNKLLTFSKNFSPQFRIDLDILVKNYSLENISKLKRLIKKLPNNFLRIFFIYNWINKSFLKYEVILRKLIIFKNNIFTLWFFRELNYNSVWKRF